MTAERVETLEAELAELMSRRLALGQELEQAHFAYKSATDKAAALAVSDEIRGEILELEKEMRSKRKELEFLLEPVN